eukprot:COSAG01_NODE_20139_length_969_cov_0.975862_1_plen_224_part_00
MLPPPVLPTQPHTLPSFALVVRNGSSAALRGTSHSSHRDLIANCCRRSTTCAQRPGRIPESCRTPGGGGGAQLNVNPPGGFEYRTVLPQAAKYSNPKGAIFHARGGSEPYFTYMCLVTHVANGSVHFDPAVGCDQGAEGLSNGRAWDWYLENVKEECDSAGEYFFDAEEEALYYTFNGTDAPTGTEELAFTQVILLFFVFNLWITISPWRSPGSVEVIHRQTP